MKTHSSQSRTNAFTLVELLVVIAIIGILIGMLLPAVQMVREAARRTSCSNQIAQIGLAVHNYEFSHEHLPAGVTNPTGPIASSPTGMDVSFLVEMLPYVEQYGISKNFDATLGAYSPANAPARSQVIELFVCPSFFPPTNSAGTAGISNYAGCHHGGETPIDKDNNGVLFLNSKINFGEIVDGASNTILIGELIPLATDLGWASGTRSALRNTSTIMDRTAHEALAKGPVPAPNVVGGFGSFHPGGANFCLADGSVRFLSIGTAPVTLSNLGDRKDAAMMGSW